MAHCHELRRQSFALTAQQHDLRDAFRAFCATHSGLDVVRAAERTGFDPALWRRLVGMGALSMALPEAVGGDDADMTDLLVVAIELGRAMAPVPWVDHVVTSRLLARCSDGGPVPGDLLTAALTGTSVLGIDLSPPAADRRHLVASGSVASGVVVRDGDGLILLRADTPPATIANQGSLPMGRWDPSTGKRTVLADGAAAQTLLAAANAEWRILWAGSLIGLCEGALDSAVAFARTRQTKGKSIATLQAISHPLANIHIETRSARNVAIRAAWMWANEPAARPDLPFVAFGCAAKTAGWSTSVAAHVQGGLGFTAESAAGMYFLRSKGWSLAGGPLSIDDALTLGRLLVGAAAGTADG